MNFTTVQSEGSLIAADLLAQIYTGEAPGQRSADFGLNGRVRLIDEIAACWSDARAYWEALQHGLKRVRKEESGASATREQWVIPLLRSLGFEGIAYAGKAALVGGRSYSISHRLGHGEQGLPIHIAGVRNDLDKRPPAGRPRISPHALVQEYLNRTEHLWAIVTNGLKLRLLRDAARMSRPVYLEFDLQQMMEGEHFAEFQLFYRLVHRSRWPADLDSAHECLLEKYYQQGIEAGGRVRERLRDGVEQALKIFGNGFLSQPGNLELCRQISEGRLSAGEYYRQLLRLIYRFLFLMVSEERGLVGPDPENDLFREIYGRFYSVSRLRSAVERPVNPEERHWDLWESVKQTFRLYCFDEEGEKLGVAPLDGDLFGPLAIPDLEQALLFNRDFLHGFAHLSLFKEEKVTRRINYAYLDVEELGSVYESLLDYAPVIRRENGSLRFDLAFGTERKSTGSYYTRPELVQELIRSALEPVMEERLGEAGSSEEKAAALLSLRVCDPACGSGHFLLAAARRIGKELARVRTGEEHPTPGGFRQAVREVIRHCIYGVDLNPLAVDLCKLSLWLEGHSRGLPLTFLDHRVKCGNSLVGLDSMERLKEGIPDEAFRPVSGDDRVVSREIKARNRKERREWEEKRHQKMLGLEFIDEKLEQDLEAFALQARGVDSLGEDSAEEVGRKQQAYEKIITGGAWHRDLTAANIWAAAFFCPLKDANDPAVPTHERLMRYLEGPGSAHGRLVGQANGLAVKHRFFHWPLEFPDVAGAGGFDVVLGNPPWEMLETSEKEFFANHAPDIANAPTSRQRRKLIENLSVADPQLYATFRESKRYAAGTRHFVQNSNLYPYSSVGRINSYPLFVEKAAQIVNVDGFGGIIVPSAISMEAYNIPLFKWLVKQRRIKSFLDFENRAAIFPGVHRSYRFSLFTFGGLKSGLEKITLGFFFHDSREIKNPERIIQLSIDELASFSPNTLAPPIFITKKDYLISKQIYQRFGVLVNRREGVNSLWNASIQRMLSLSDPGDLFRKYEELEELTESEIENDWCRLYSGKSIHQFNHRFASYRSGKWKLFNKNDLENEYLGVVTEYFARSEEVEKRLKDKFPNSWLAVYRDVTNATNERTALATIIPYAGCDTTCRNIFFQGIEGRLIVCLIGNINSFVLDYFGRQKVIGTHLGAGIIEQFPFLPPTVYKKPVAWANQSNNEKWLFIRILELLYTAWDLSDFAKDCGYDGPPFKWDEDRRFLLRCELDAAYFHLYGIERDDVDYIMETFPIVKRKDEKQYREYRTKRVILEIYDEMAEAMRKGKPYQTLLNPPPAPGARGLGAVRGEILTRKERSEV